MGLFILWGLALLIAWVVGFYDGMEFSILPFLAGMCLVTGGWFGKAGFMFGGVCFVLAGFAWAGLFVWSQGGLIPCLPILTVALALTGLFTMIYLRYRPGSTWNG